MVLLDYAFHGRGKSRNLSFEGGGTWFISLVIVGGSHQANEYHTTFCPGNGSMASTMTSFPQTAPTDDAKNHQ